MKQRAGQFQPASRVASRALLATAVACALLAWSGAHADPSAPADAEFDSALLAGGSQQAADLSRFERGNPVMPGIYRLDLYLGGQWTTSGDVRFAAPDPNANAVACFTPELMRQMGLPQDRLDEAARTALADPAACVELGTLVPDAMVQFDQSELRLDVTVPQAWLGYRPLGYVGPDQWDAGTTAAILNYDLNSYHTSSNGRSQTSSFLGLSAGINVGGWRFRHDSSMYWQSGVAGQPSQHRWQAIDTYARRDITAWRSQLTIGDSHTSGELFDTIGMRGVQLATDDRMLPESLRGYAPTVRGVAETNAKVSIRQNGVLLRETTVSPGPFVIDDLYATGYGGDLTVFVTEADGRVREFSVPYASVPQQLRPGTTRYSVNAGKVHDDGVRHESTLVQVIAQHGVTNLFTGYGGLLGTDGYLAALGGLSFNTSFGALAFDVTSARTSLPGQGRQSGQSLRTTYSRMLPTTGTSFSLASYRYSTSGYYSLRDALVARDIANGYQIDDELLDGQADQELAGVLTPEQRAALQGQRSADLLASSHGLAHQRNRFDINLNQRLGDVGGTLYATASARDYWSREGTDLQFQLGYNNRFRSLSYSISASRLRDFDGRFSNQFFVSFSVPLGDSPRAPTLSAGLVRENDGNQQSQLMLTGTAGADNQYSYGAGVAHGDETGTSANINGGYRGSHGVANVSFGQGDGYSQASLGLAGTAVAFADGITFGQPAGETMAIVSAPHAAGARLLNAPGVKLDGHGRALLPYLTPYNLNSVELDPKGLPLDVQLASTSIHVAPRAGSVTVLKFDTEYGRAVVAHLTREDGRPVPFGAEVSDGQGRILGVVGQSGRLLLRGIEEAGTLSLSWQEDSTQRLCSINYRLPPRSDTTAATQYSTLEGQCSPGAISLTAGR
ncbi:MAG TPA: fimbria/pilus outer membrane usher protein [Lysobacter sp.]